MLLQHSGIVVERSLGGWIDVAAVEAEKHRLERRVTVEIVQRGRTDGVIAHSRKRRRRLGDRRRISRRDGRRHRGWLRLRSRRRRQGGRFLRAARGGKSDRDDKRESRSIGLHFEFLSTNMNVSSTSSAAGFRRSS